MEILKSKLIEQNRRDSVDSSSSGYYNSKHVKFDNDSSASSSTSSINYDRLGTSINLRPSRIDSRKVQSAFGMSTTENIIQKPKNQRNSISFGKTKEPSLTKSQIKLDILKKRSPNEIEILKHKDPIFAKRHKQFINAKICNKAPKFDYNDFYIKIVPESKLRRNRSDMIEKNRDDESDQPKLLKAEIEKIDHRVKQFIKNFSTHTF